MAKPETKVQCAPERNLEFCLLLFFLRLTLKLHHPSYVKSTEPSQYILSYLSNNRCKLLDLPLVYSFLIPSSSSILALSSPPFFFHTSVFSSIALHSGPYNISPLSITKSTYQYYQPPLVTRTPDASCAFHFSPKASFLSIKMIYFQNIDRYARNKVVCVNQAIP